MSLVWEAWNIGPDGQPADRIWFCRRGRHRWTEKEDAWRCCSPEWRREVRLAGGEDDLDPSGRQSFPCGPYILIYGWVPIDP